MTLFLLLWPLAVSLILFAFRPANARILALVASLVEMAASFYVVAFFDHDASVQWVYNIPWISVLGISFHVGMDGIALLLVLLATVLVPFIILASFGHDYDKPNAFYGLILLMQSALIGVFVARDGFLFYVFWELALIPIYFICLMWGGTNRARITLKFFIYTLLGSLLMLVGLIFLYSNTTGATPGSHSFDMQALYKAGHSLKPGAQGFYFWMFFIAFAIKMPVFPFHTWQPDTYTVAPAPGTMLLSGIMLKMGIFGLIRWLIPVFPLGVAEWGKTAIILSVIGIVYSSVIALVQKDFKRLIAYSSIAHVGLIAAGVMTLTKIGIQGAMIQMISHGMVVVAMFYCVEIISERTKTTTLSMLGGIRNVAPIFTTVLLIVLLASVALPLTSGFVGEFLLINSLIRYKLILGIIAALTTIFGAVYMLKAFQTAMLGEVNALTEVFKDLTLREKFVLYPLVLLIVAIGVYPAHVLALSDLAVNNIISLAK